MSARLKTLYFVFEVLAPVASAFLLWGVLRKTMGGFDAATVASAIFTLTSTRRRA